MGLDAYAHIIVAVPMSRNDLYRTVGEKVSCPEGHAQPKGKPKFCPKDGGEFLSRKQERPTPAFALLMKEDGLDPDENEGEDHPDVPGYDWMSVAKVTSGEEKKDHIGRAVCSTGSHRRAGGPIEVDMKEIEKEVAALQELAKRLGVKGEVRVFLSLHMSY
jgi:hypothetical protein